MYFLKKFYLIDVFFLDDKAIIINLQTLVFQQAFKYYFEFTKDT